MTESKCKLWQTTKLNSLPPLITRVCHESRGVALENGGLLGDDEDTNAPCWLGINSIPRPWLNPNVDIIHLNWDPTYTVDHPNGGNPIPVFLHEAAKSQGASFMAELLHSLDPTYSSTIPWKQFNLLEHGGSYFVTLKTVVIHMTSGQAIQSGLFGKLGEEKVKLVDALDTKTINQFKKTLQCLHEGDIGENKFLDEPNLVTSWPKQVKNWIEDIERLWIWHELHRAYREHNEIELPEELWLPKSESSELSIGLSATMKERVLNLRANKSHSWVKQVLALMPVLHPVIMFRHCAENCHL